MVSLGRGVVVRNFLLFVLKTEEVSKGTATVMLHIGL